MEYLYTIILLALVALLLLGAIHATHKLVKPAPRADINKLKRRMTMPKINLVVILMFCLVLTVQAFTAVKLYSIQNAIGGMSTEQDRQLENISTICSGISDIQEHLNSISSISSSC